MGLVEQILQVVGAILILAAFILAQRGVLDQHSRSYLVTNAVGGALLAVLALLSRNWGFFLLETVWALVAVWGLIRPSAPSPSTH
ncbi:MAG TPA: hypothetical protein VGR21_09035 [Cryptosporangiaceae bacterium]|nr:hypothetical protein [Cryptosporangiaceae bacterium]